MSTAPEARICSTAAGITPENSPGKQAGAPGVNGSQHGTGSPGAHQDQRDAVSHHHCEWPAEGHQGIRCRRLRSTCTGLSGYTGFSDDTRFSGCSGFSTNTGFNDKGHFVAVNLVHVLEPAGRDAGGVLQLGPAAKHRGGVIAHVQGEVAGIRVGERHGHARLHFSTPQKQSELRLSG
jgi:hypothetical protein